VALVRVADKPTRDLNFGVHESAIAWRPTVDWIIMFGRYSILARQAVMVARLEAGLVGADQIDSEHLLIAVMSVHPELPKLLNASIELSQLREQCDRWHTPSSPILNSRDLPFTADLRRVFKRVESIADGR